MPRRARSQVTYESRVEDVKRKIKENPQKALREIGKFLVSQIRIAAPKSNIKARWIRRKDGRLVLIKPGRLKKGVSYWLRRIEGDLQVGVKSFYAPYIEFGSERVTKKPFVEPAVMRNVSVIQNFISDALRELNN